YSVVGSGVTDFTVSKDGDYIFLQAHLGGSTADDSFVRIDLSTPFDLTTASLGQDVDLGISSAAWGAIEVSADGTFLYTKFGSSVRKFTMSTPFDLTTATVTSTPTNSTIFGGSVGSGVLSFFTFSEDGMYFF